MTKQFISTIILMIILLSCDQTTKSRTDLPKNTLELDQYNETLKDSNAIVIRMRSDSIIMIEQYVVPLDSLPKYLQIAREKRGKDAPVSLYVKGSTPYGVYAGVQLTLENELSHFRDQEAIDKYEKHYDDLNKREQLNVNAIHHLRIIEHTAR